MWVVVYFFKFYLFVVILVHQLPWGVQSVMFALCLCARVGVCVCVCGNIGATNTVKMF